MIEDILKILRTFIYKHRLNRDPDKWVLELGVDESEALVKECYERCGANDRENRHTRYKNNYSFEDFVKDAVYLRINTFRGVTIEWFRPKLAFREKEVNNGEK